MFTWGEGCKHTLFFDSQQAAQGTGSTGNRQHREQAAGSTGNRQHREQAAQEASSELCAQFVHMAQRSFTTRVFCTICSQWHAAHSLRASCLP